MNGGANGQRDPETARGEAAPPHHPFPLLPANLVSAQRKRSEWKLTVEAHLCKQCRRYQPLGGYLHHRLLILLPYSSLLLSLSLACSLTRCWGNKPPAPPLISASLSRDCPPSLPFLFLLPPSPPPPTAPPRHSPPRIQNWDADPAGLRGGRALTRGQLWQQQHRQRKLRAVARVRIGRRKPDRRRGGQHGGRRSRGGRMHGWRQQRRQLGRHSERGPVSLLELGESAFHHR